MITEQQGQNSNKSSLNLLKLISKKFLFLFFLYIVILDNEHVKGYGRSITNMNDGGNWNTKLVESNNFGDVMVMRD